MTNDMLKVPEIAFCCYAVTDVAHARGVRFRTELFPTPVCRMAMVFDPDGNAICIHKRNPGR